MPDHLPAPVPARGMRPLGAASGRVRARRRAILRTSAGRANHLWTSAGHATSSCRGLGGVEQQDAANQRRDALEADSQLIVDLDVVPDTSTCTSATSGSESTQEPRGRGSSSARAASATKSSLGRRYPIESTVRSKGVNFRPTLRGQFSAVADSSEDGSGRATRQRLLLQRDQLTAQSQLFGKATSRTRHHRA